MKRERGRRRSAEPEPIGSVLDDLGRDRLGTGLALGRLGRAWTQVVGDRLASECAPVRLEAGLLLVGVSSSAWAAQVKFLAGEIAKAANRVLEDTVVREVRVVVLQPPSR